MTLRRRVVMYDGKGQSHRTIAARFRVSMKFVNDMGGMKCETGGLEPRVLRTQNWITRRHPFMCNLLPRIYFIDESLMITHTVRITCYRPKTCA